MSEDEKTYSDQIEEQKFLKRQAAEVWAEAISKMMIQDPDKAIVFQEGIKALFEGPPMPQMLRDGPTEIPPSNFPPPTFEDIEADGTTAIYDWPFIAQRCSHLKRETDALVVCYDGSQIYMTLTGPPAVAFWKWITAVRNSRGQGPVDAEVTNEEPEA